MTSAHYGSSPEPRLGRPRPPVARATAALLGLLLATGCGGSPEDPGPPADAAPHPDAALTDGGVRDAAPPADAHPPTDGATDPDAGVPADPGEAGPETPTTWTATVPVGSGGEATTLTVTLHGPEAAGPHPVLVFTHGFQLGPSNYASTGRHLASWGYVVVMPQMPGSLLSAPSHRLLAVYLGELLDWVEANGTTAGGPLQGKADPTHLALAGHSMGGKISLLVASQDSRPLAVVGVDPVDAAGGPMGGDPVEYPSVTPELMPQITVPLVLLGETVNATGGMGGACAPADQNFQQYYEHAASPALEVEVLGANHMSFLDDPNCGMACFACPAGTDDPAVTLRLTQRTLTAFLEVVLRGHAAFRHWLTGPGMAADVTSSLVSTRQKNGF